MCYIVVCDLKTADGDVQVDDLSIFEIVFDATGLQSPDEKVYGAYSGGMDIQ